MTGWLYRGQAFYKCDGYLKGACEHRLNSEFDLVDRITDALSLQLKRAYERAEGLTLAELAKPAKANHNKRKLQQSRLKANLDRIDSKLKAAQRRFVEVPTDMVHQSRRPDPRASAAARDGHRSPWADGRGGIAISEASRPAIATRGRGIA